MRRNFLRGLIICLIPTLIAGVFVFLAIQNELAGKVGFRRGIDLAGGTILVYEVDTDRLKEQARVSGSDRAEMTAEDMRTLAGQLKKRIDPADQQNVIVRPVGSTRVEIILPLTGSTSGEKEGLKPEFEQEVRNLVKQQGVLEFRILANQADDGPALSAAQQLLDSPNDEQKKLIQEAAEKGFPPPSPDGEFSVKAQGEDELPVRYAWVEMGKEERDSYKLSNKYKNDTKTNDAGVPNNGMYLTLEARRGKTYVSGGSDEGKSHSYLLYSRAYSKRVPVSGDENKEVEYFVLTRVSPYDSMKVVGNIGISASVGTDPGKGTIVDFRLKGDGPAKFGAMNTRNKPSESVKRNLAVIMDDKIVSMPTLGAALREGGYIYGNFTQASANSLVQILRSGNLNAALKPDPVSENTIGSTLGETTKTNGLIAIVASFAAVLLFMVVYYRFSGLVACVALFVNLLLTVGFMVAMHAAFTLPGLAGIVLMLGMAVDANVLIYERLREEREKGATLSAAIRAGYDRALPTIIDTHLTSIFTAVVLYAFGNDALKGFSVSLTVGLIISLFTSLYITRLMFDFWNYKKWLTELKMMRLFARPTFDFMKIRNAMFALTGFLTVAGLGLFLLRGEKNLNVDFTQGTALGGRLKDGEQRSLGEMLALLDEKRQEKLLKVSEVVPLSNEELLGERRTGENIYKIKFADGPEAVVSLANKPEGGDEKAQLDNLKERVERLPDVSVEQVFQAGDKFESGKARSFTIRTTEREKELVSVILDRLLRDENGLSILDAPQKVGDVKIVGGVATVAFSKGASPAYLRGLVLRELSAVKPGSKLVDDREVVNVTGVPTEEFKVEEEKEQRFRTLTIDVSKNPDFKALVDPAAKAETKAEDLKSLQDVVDKAVASLQARPLPDRLETFDPALAKETRERAMWAILFSWVAILAFLWFRFGSWQFGLAAVICLVHDLCFTLGAIALCHYLHATPIGAVLGLQDFKIDLAAVAALLTLVGYSVNDTIVVFDRIREVRGKNPTLTPQMINDSVNGTLSRTVLAALTVFLVVVVLYIFGGEGVHLFAFVMVMGVIVGTYSSIYIASPLLLIFGEGKRTLAAGQTPPTDGDPAGLPAAPASIG